MESSKLGEFSGPRQESPIEIPKPVPWTEMTCHGRTKMDGQKEIILSGREMIEKKEFDKLRDERDKQVGELIAANKILKNHVARLSMTVTLKEEKIVDLTKELHVMKEKVEYFSQFGMDQEDSYNEDMKHLTIGGPEGDSDASMNT